MMDKMRPGRSGIPALALTLRGWQASGKQILGAVTLQVAKGETLALVGPSGVGKTSLLRLVAGLEPSLDGECDVSGRIAMVFQEPTLLPWKTALENICLASGCGTSEAEDWLSRVGLSGRGADVPGQFSLGQQRRLSLARAFACEPALLLMDEPFVSLDPAQADDMMQLFETLRAQTDVATLIVTHIEAEAARLADRILHLRGAPAKLI